LRTIVLQRQISGRDLGARRCFTRARVADGDIAGRVVMGRRRNGEEEKQRCGRSKTGNGHEMLLEDDLIAPRDRRRWRQAVAGGARGRAASWVVAGRRLSKRCGWALLSDSTNGFSSS